MSQQQEFKIVIRTSFSICKFKSLFIGQNYPVFSSIFINLVVGFCSKSFALMEILEQKCYLSASISVLFVTKHVFTYKIK